MRNRKSTVIGHHHSYGAIFYISNDDETIFGMNTGCLIDRDSIAFRYAKNAAFAPTLGVGVVIEGVPHFVPMITHGKRKRWIKEVIV